MRRANRIDSNQNEIVKALRSINGVSVELNVNDIFVGYKGFNYWYELKSGRAVSKRTGKVKESSKQKSQKRLSKTWKGHYKIVSTLDEILKDMGIIK